MFKKLKTINFEELRNINFQPPKWKDDFHSYFDVMEKILDVFLELEEYEKVISNKDKIIFKKDINLFSSILGNIGTKGWKDPNNTKFKKEKFNKQYINWLNARKGIYEDVLNLVTKKDEDFNTKITGLEEEQKSKIEIKDEEIKKINLNNEKLEERIEKQKETIIKQSSSINELKADLADKELNKLALSFGKEEEKYKSGTKKMIYIGFSILSISPIFIIIFLLIDLFLLDYKYQNDIYILSIPLGILTIIGWYFLYFQLKNYYINRDLETNFANRKAVANSFKGLLEMVDEEENFGDTTELKSKFFEKVSNILYAEIDTSNIKKHSENIPISKLLDTVNELIKKVK